MKRNENRTWYDKGYSDGVTATKQDGIVPRVIGVLCLSLLLFYDIYWPLAFVSIWAVFSLQEWWDNRKYHEPTDPPEVWE